ncbi:MAG TPA: phosphate ABC transporter ATP-binding protein [Thermoplasmata archaeon]|jgi:tungstate transport system ATP-binding protein|nr:phosphate ABC transporter ATP-binding protein [Thermoplasmata archaeon]
MTMSLAVEGLHKGFDGRPVLRDVRLAVEPGEVFAIVGPSGAGKTTLLRCIDFLTVPDSGAVRYDGTEAPPDVAGRLALRRRIGMVAQNPLLFRGTVFYNASFGLCVRGVPDAIVAERTREALESVGLGDRLEAPAKSLSAGEAQRVAFARASVVRPDLLLLDEFTANLDPANVKALEEAVRAYASESGATIVLVTHNLFQAKRLAKRAALLLGGQFIESADADTFFTNPSDPRTGAFVRGEIPY